LISYFLPTVEKPNLLRKVSATTMRGRMPFPIPFLPALAVAIVISAILPTLLKMCGRLGQDDHDRGSSLPAETTNPDLSSEDPFSDQPGEPATTSRTAEVAIKAKFVEYGSRTEELPFDWIVPFEESVREE